MATKQQATTSSLPPKTEYVYVGDKYKGTQQTKQTKGDVLKNVFIENKVSVPQGLPQWLGSQRILGASWMAAMIIIGFDEWHNLGILPRPIRLWDTSTVYGILALVGIVDALVPLVNALAIGYTIMLLWQYYNGSGQFASTAKKG